jgi:hypothetical protein
MDGPLIVPGGQEPTAAVQGPRSTINRVQNP